MCAADLTQDGVDGVDGLRAFLFLFYVYEMGRDEMR